MGCVSSSARVSSIKSNARKYPDADDFEGPVKGRSCTDIVFLFLLAVYLIFLLAAITTGCIRGDPRRLVYGVDDYGNLCGLKNEKIAGAEKSGEDYTNKKYLKVETVCAIDGCVEQKECVEECPEDYELMALRRCMSSRANDMAGTIAQSAMPYLETVASDISICWREIILMCFISVGLSVVLLIIFRFCATVLIWGVLVVVSIASVAVTIYVWVMWNQRKQELADYSGPNYELKQAQVKNWLTAAVILTILTALYILVVLFLRKKIKLVAALFEEAGKSVAAMPLVLLQPAWTFISLVLVCCFLLVGFVCLQTSGKPLVASDGKVTFPLDTFFQVMQWLFLFGFLWLTQFILACQNLIIAGAVATWYFTRGLLGTEHGSERRKVIVDNRCRHHNLERAASVVASLTCLYPLLAQTNLGE